MSQCEDENCTAHGELVRLRKQVLRQRTDLIWVMLLWASTTRDHMTALGSSRCETCGWILDANGGCAWCNG